MTFILLSVSMWNDVADHVFDGVELAGLRVGPMLFHWPNLLIPFLTSTVFPVSFFYRLGSWDWGLRTDRV